MHVPGIPRVIRRKAQPKHIVALRPYQRAIEKHLLNYIDEISPTHEINVAQRARGWDLMLFASVEQRLFCV